MIKKPGIQEKLKTCGEPCGERSESRSESIGRVNFLVSWFPNKKEGKTPSEQAKNRH